MNREHVDNVCKFGEGAFTCSYLATGADGFECLKGTELEKLVDQRRAEKSIDTMGDNCSGPPKFEVFKMIVT